MSDTPIKTCEYCGKKGEMPTFMTGETMCRKCRSDLPTDPRELRHMVNDLRKANEWKSVDSMPVGDPVLLKFKDELTEFSNDDHWPKSWSGLIFIGKYKNELMGISFAAPVGHGGISKKWIEGWKPLTPEQDR